MARKKKARSAAASPPDMRDAAAPHPSQAPSAPRSSKGGAHHDVLPINAQFAQRYEVSKRKQLLATVPAAVLDASDGESSSSEEEDEFGELLTKGIDRRVHETLQAIRAKDPRIYDRDTRFFEHPEPDAEEEGSGEDAGADADSASADDDEDGDVQSDDEPVAGWDTIANAANVVAPKMTLKDYVRENLLKDGRLSDSDDEQEIPDEQDYQQSQRYGFENAMPAGALHQPNPSGLREGEAQNPLWDDNDDADEEEAEIDADDDATFFTKKSKTKDELEAEDEDFDAFLRKQNRKNSRRAGEELLLHSYLENEKPDEKERFLRDFVLNNGWLDKKASDAPAARDYEIEIDNTDPNAKPVNGEEAEHDEDFEDKADEFEANYNFRFEDPDAGQVMSHARKIQDSMRRPDDRRKRAREARKLRKEQEKVAKTEDIKQLKNLKKKEINARLLAIQDAAGDGIDVSGIDLDADFDPAQYNQQMQNKFGEDYYAQQDEDMDVVTEEGAAVASDVRLPLKHSKKAPEDIREDVSKMMDEYYNLDYEDIVGGVPMRFNYKKVEPESFNLATEDILSMEDKELNRLVSLKFLAPYMANRDIKKQAWRVGDAIKKKKYAQRAEAGRNSAAIYAMRLKGVESEAKANDEISGGEGDPQATKRKKKKKRKSLVSETDIPDVSPAKNENAAAEASHQEANGLPNDASGVDDGTVKKSRKRKRKKKKLQDTEETAVGDDAKEHSGSVILTPVASKESGDRAAANCAADENDQPKKKKGKKRKSKAEAVEGLSAARKEAYNI